MIQSISENHVRAPFTPASIPLALDDFAAADAPVFAEPLSLSEREAVDVLLRGNSARVTYRSPDGRSRTTRTPYAYSDGAMYMPSPAWSAVLEHGLTHRVECDVSELSGLSYWRYVRAEGEASLLQPTGDTAERAEWRHGMEQLERGMLLSQSVQSLAFGNFGVVRVDIEQKAGLLRLLD